MRRNASWQITRRNAITGTFVNYRKGGISEGNETHVLRREGESIIRRTDNKITCLVYQGDFSRGAEVQYEFSNDPRCLNIYSARRIAPTRHRWPLMPQHESFIRHSHEAESYRNVTKNGRQPFRTISKIECSAHHLFKVRKKIYLYYNMFIYIINILLRYII